MVPYRAVDLQTAHVVRRRKIEAPTYLQAAFLSLEAADLLRAWDSHWGKVNTDMGWKVAAAAAALLPLPAANADSRP